MIIFKEAAALSKYLTREQHKTGFVPTMGALHDGHISLIKCASLETETTVSSIFVNPTQFNDQKDYDKYPTSISQDIFMLEQSGCDVLFLPSVNEIYPAGLVSSIHYNLGVLENILEGKFRPNHFQGVCQVVHRLLEIVKPDVLYLGQKDYQQYLVLKRLVEQLGLPIEIRAVGTHREVTGLAMSSRNLRLSKADKDKATAIFDMLDYIKNNFESIDLRQLEKHATQYLLAHGFSNVNYVSIADAETLQPIDQVSAPKKAIALIAASIGEVRLIDNILLN
jgi:pantoate--beta-alanine ligase